VSACIFPYLAFLEAIFGFSWFICIPNMSKMYKIEKNTLMNAFKCPIIVKHMHLQALSILDTCLTRKNVVNLF